MRNTARKPPILLRWLSPAQRITLAGKVRDKASDVAEWIAPELNPERISSYSRVRYGFYALAGAAAAVIVAICIYDASSADIGLNGRPTVQRASGWAW